MQKYSIWQTCLNHCCQCVQSVQSKNKSAKLILSPFEAVEHLKQPSILDFYLRKSPCHTHNGSHVLIAIQMEISTDAIVGLTVAKTIVQN